MKLNQVTLPASDLVTSIAFYEKLGFVLIVKDVHYTRLENPSDLSTLSLEKRIDGGDARMFILNATISTPVSGPERKGRRI
jgi:catechol 2,3-dioxygenase-like lactoylglutathione lyase family enzyme